MRTQAGEIKASESRHASVRQKRGWLDSSATSWRRPNTSCWARPSHSADAGRRACHPEGTLDQRSAEAGPEAPRNMPACRSSRSRERTGTFAAAGRNLKKLSKRKTNRGDRLKCFSHAMANDLADTLNFHPKSSRSVKTNAIEFDTKRKFSQTVP